MTKKFDYTEAKQKLDDLVEWFENNNSVEEALGKYKEAEAILDDMQKYLDITEAKIKEATKKIG
jgi:exonuclease VII small subunit